MSTRINVWSADRRKAALLFGVMGASFVGQAEALIPGIGGTVALSTYAMMLITAFMAWMRSVLKKAGKSVKALPGAQPTLRLLGVDKFSTFELKVVVHELKDTVGTVGAAQVRITHSGKTRQTSVQKGGKWEETLKMTVKQGVPTAKVELFCKTTLGRMKMFGAAKLDINKSIIQMGFPKRYELQLMRDKRRVGDIIFSFAPAQALEGEAAKVAKSENDKTKNVHSTIVAQTQQRMLANAATGLNAGKSSGLPVSYGANSDFTAEKASFPAADTSAAEANSPDEETNRRIRALTALGQVCSGPVEVNTMLGMKGQRKMFIERDGSEWFLAWQKDEDASSKKRVNWDNVQQIKPSEKKNEFTIIYSERIEQTMTVKAVDRESEHWTHGLHLFKKEFNALKTHQSMVRKAKRKFLRKAMNNAADNEDSGRLSGRVSTSSIGGASGGGSVLGFPAGSKAAQVIAGLSVPGGDSSSESTGGQSPSPRPSGRIIDVAEARDRGQYRESKDTRGSSRVRLSNKPGSSQRASSAGNRTSTSVPAFGRISSAFGRSSATLPPVDGENKPKTSMRASVISAPKHGVKNLRALSQGVRASVLIAGNEVRDKAKDVKTVGSDLKDTIRRQRSKNFEEQNPGSQAALSMV